MPDSKMGKLIRQGRQLIQEARYVVALTGAGISTPSGIPDFRSPDSGLWEQADPFTVASLAGFRRQPRHFYEWVRPLAELTINAKPNPAHFALALMESKGPLRAIITQNMDMLHTRAGSQTVLEVHGHLREATCQGCGQVVAAEPLLRAFIRSSEIPHCQTCAGVFKPNVILFGEMMPTAIFEQAERAIRDCDLLIVAGSSLTVTPVAELPRLAAFTGAKIIIVNLEATHADAFADVVLRGDVVDMLPALAAVFDPAEGGVA